jgi:hypothetical protein
MVWSVPIVVLFTKFDALGPVALGKLAPADRQLPGQERLLKAKALIEGIFNRADVWGRLSKMMYPPTSHVQIGGLYHVFMYTYWFCYSQIFQACINLMRDATVCSKTLQLS